MEDANPVSLDEPSKNGTEISVTGKWVPTTPDGWFFRSESSREMRSELQAIHDEARAHEGVLSTEINHGVGQDAVLIHHVFAGPDAMVDYFETVARKHRDVLVGVARPELHLMRGLELPATAREAIGRTGVDIAFGEHRFGWVKNDYRQPDPAKAIQVTAKWTAKPGHTRDELEHWWKTVAREAWGLEEGLVRFEAYDVAGQEALIIHETFTDTAELRFHLTRGTASTYKKPLDEVATPECYFFRGPVSWDIRTYSRFMHLPATYTSKGSAWTANGGTWSEGRTGPG
ncbi:MAG: hypothetical protein KC912_20375 [Proteobacteria bacterium]|nr:hypothetical protein [Pseudomonadota bacterium]